MAGRLSFLVDTNIWLEVLLAQAKSDEALNFLQNVDTDKLAITDFSVHSIGVILLRLKKETLFDTFLADTMNDTGLSVIRLDAADLRNVLMIAKRFSLDFDDAYQYVAAEKHGLMLVSFDRDFDRTERGRTDPSAATAHSENRPTEE